MLFVQFFHSRVESDGRVPEVAEHSHAARVVPDVCRHDGHDSRGFGDGPARVEHEIQREPAHYHVESVVREGQKARVADERRSVVGDPATGNGQKTCGRGQADHSRRLGGRKHCLGQSAGTAADIQPTRVRRHAESANEPLRDRLAKAAQVRFIRLTSCPDFAHEETIRPVGGLRMEPAVPDQLFGARPRTCSNGSSPVGSKAMIGVVRPLST